jgi:hypothetical protein
MKDCGLTTKLLPVLGPVGNSWIVEVSDPQKECALGRVALHMFVSASVSFMVSLPKGLL